MPSAAHTAMAAGLALGVTSCERVKSILDGKQECTCDCASLECDKAEAPPQEVQHPSLGQCKEFVAHLEVLVAQTHGVPAKGLHTDDERDSAIKHCVEHTRLELVNCALELQTWGELNSCVPKAGERPRLLKPTQDECRSFADRLFSVNSSLMGRLRRPAVPPTDSARQATVKSCMESNTKSQVECTLQAHDHLSAATCEVIYVRNDQNRPTAEQCERYGDVMLGVIAKVLGTVPRPLGWDQALQTSGLAAWVTPAIQRFQLVNTCHQMSKEAIECHMAAEDIPALGQCKP